MATRYSRIRQANQLARALVNLRAYEDRIPDPQVNSRGARDPSKNVYVVPFGRDIDTDEVVRVRNSVQGYTALAARVNQADTEGETTDVLGAKTVRVMNGFKPARIVWFRNTTRAVETKISEATRNKYLKYNGERSSCAFGRKVATDNQYDAFDQIKTAIMTTGPAQEVNRVTLTPEVIRYN